MILIVILLNLSLSMCAVLNSSNKTSCCLIKPVYNQSSRISNNKTIHFNSAKQLPSIQGLVRSKCIATVPSCMEIGDILDSAVKKVTKFNFKSFLQKYDHLIFNRIVREISRIPPITGAYLLLSTIPAFVSYFFNNNLPLSWMVYDYDKVLEGELWRLFTPFFILGRLWFSFYISFSAVFSHMGSVELAHMNKPEKFIEFLTFGILSLSAYSFIESYFVNKYSLDMKETYESIPSHFHIFLVYFWSRLNEGTSVDCFDLFSAPVEFIPYFFLVQNFLSDKYALKSDLVALFFSYLYFNLFSNKKTCPVFKIFKTDALRKLYLKFRDEIPY